MGCTPASMVYVPGWDKHSVYVGGFWRFSSLWCLDNSSVFKTIWKRANVCIYIYITCIYIPRPSNDTFICVSILFCSCCGFSRVCKKLLFCRKMLEGAHSFPIVSWICYSFWICGFLHFFADICSFFAQIFARTSVASKQTIPVFSRAREAKRK